MLNNAGDYWIEYGHYGNVGGVGIVILLRFWERIEFIANGAWNLKAFMSGFGFTALSTDDDWVTGI